MPVGLQNNRLLSALSFEPIDRPPIWVMRQAGRYLPEYRAIRSKYSSFMDFCRQPEAAAEATCQPLQRFNLDAAIVFSDILTIPDAMGCPVTFIPGTGPVFNTPIRSEADLNALQIDGMRDKLDYVGQAVYKSVESLQGSVPLIGFAGAPWTVACYMVEGGGSKLFFTTRSMLYQRPDLLHALLDKITTVSIDYLIMQVEQGAQALMLFDSWAGLLSPHAHDMFSLSYLSRIRQALAVHPTTKDIPVMAFCKQAHHAYIKLADAGFQGLGVDWSIPLSFVRDTLGDRPVALQGNLDPAVMLSSPERVQQEARLILDSHRHSPGHIMNLGHGIDKSTPIENMQALVETVTSYSYEHP